MDSRANPRTHSEYTVGWICALETELNAARAALDEEHPGLTQSQGDTNIYIVGSVLVETGRHNVVIACLPSGQYGTNSAAIAATQMTRTFQNLRFGLMVGIGGGVPNITDDPSTCSDIRLGDVVVGVPTPGCPGVLQYGLGKLHQGERWPSVSGTLNKPPRILRNAIQILKSNFVFGRRSMSAQVDAILQKFPSLALDYAYQGAENDVLFRSSSAHVGTGTTCEKCSTSDCQTRPTRNDNRPQVFYGTIASGDQVVKDSVTRDYWRDKERILCFEMEAAGLVDEFDCLVIRGICDYADSHKNKRWQPYAAITAAAYAKNLLLEVAADDAPVDRSNNHSKTNETARITELVDKPNVYNLEELQSCFWFRGIDDRYENVEKSYKGTFRWLLHYDNHRADCMREEFDALTSYRKASSEQRYSHWFQTESQRGFALEWDPWGLIKWLREGDGVLSVNHSVLVRSKLTRNSFLSGKPGSGKSTFMKYLFEDPIYLSLLQEWANTNNLLSPYFFFWRAAGVELQKSQLGLLQSLMYQICKTRPELVPKLIEPQEALDAIKRHRSQAVTEISCWNIYELRRFLRRLVAINDLKLCWLIDGLDEFEGDPTFISEFLYELSYRNRVKILVAGRPLVEYSTAFKACTHIKLHEWTQRDIEMYTREVLMSYDYVQELASVSQQELERLVLDLIRGAEGVFMWVKTAVKSLVDGAHRGDSISELRTNLRKLPQDLYELYDGMIRSLDARYLGQTKFFLALILTALKRSEVVEVDIIAFASDYDQKDLKWFKKWFETPDEERYHFAQRVKRRVMKTCAYFITVNDSQQTFDLMHRTVLDFFETPNAQIWLYSVYPAEVLAIKHRLGQFTRYTLALRAYPANSGRGVREDFACVWDGIFACIPTYDGSHLVGQLYRQLEFVIVEYYNQEPPFYEPRPPGSRFLPVLLPNFLKFCFYCSWKKYWPLRCEIGFVHLLFSTGRSKAALWRLSLVEEPLDTEIRTTLSIMFFAANTILHHKDYALDIDNHFHAILDGDGAAFQAAWVRSLQLLFTFVEMSDPLPSGFFEFSESWVCKFTDRGADPNACVTIRTAKTGQSYSRSALNILSYSASKMRERIESDMNMKSVEFHGRYQESFARSAHLLERYGAEDFMTEEVDEAQLDWELPRYL